MSENSDILFFEDSSDIFFAEDEDNQITPPADKWKIMIIDDEMEVHRITRIVLNRFEFEGRSLEFISGYTGEEAKRLIRENPDTALIFLDVVMEQDDAGLQVVRYIRDELKNKLVRIVLRTGQPGQAPEERVIIDYDINSYKEKTEMTSQKLFTEVVSSLRSYRDLKTIDANRRGLQRIIDSITDIYEVQSLKEFGATILIKLGSILNPYNDYERCSPSGFAAMRSKGQFYIAAATGKYEPCMDKRLQDAIPNEILLNLEQAYMEKRNIIGDNSVFIYLKSKSDNESLIYLDDFQRLGGIDMELIEIFCSNISAINEAIVNTSLYEAERKQRLLSDELRELNQSLTSTFDLNQIIERLLESLTKIISYDSAWAALKKGADFEIFYKHRENALGRGASLQMGSAEQEIILQIAATGIPSVVEDTEEYSIIHERSFADGDIQSLIGVPVIYQGNLFGIIVLQSNSKYAFDEGDKGIVLTFTSQAGIAVENSRLFTEVTERNTAVKNLMDNTGQGILSFDESLCIDREYSAECEKIFRCNIAGRTLPELLFCDMEERRFWEKAFSDIIRERHSSRKEVMISLLAKECVINERYVSLEYKLINNNRIMVILTDITDKRLLESQVESERRILKMVVKAFVSYDDFIGCVRDFNYFCKKRMPEILRSGKPLEQIIAEIFRNFHTFKGIFSQLDMVNIVEKLHDLETRLSEIRENHVYVDLQSLRDFLEQYDMCSWLDEDLSTIKEILGESFIRDEKVVLVREEELLSIEKRIEGLLPPDESTLLLSELRRLRYKPFRSMLASYPEYVVRLAEKMEKIVKPFEIEGGDMLVDTDKYNAFTKSLVNVFRNMVDHGIESVYERLSAGKEETGSVTCRVSLSENQIKVEIADDGRGIDMEKIKATAVNKGIYDREKIALLSEWELIALIFRDEFSTREGITEYSGRGYGLATVKREVEKAGGSIEVWTEASAGTRFTFLLPYEEE